MYYVFTDTHSTLSLHILYAYCVYVVIRILSLSYISERLHRVRAFSVRCFMYVSTRLTLYWKGVLRHVSITCVRYACMREINSTYATQHLKVAKSIH